MKKELKRRKEHTELPRDFWNYNVNPITGFSIDDRDTTSSCIKEYRFDTEYVVHMEN